MSVKRIIPAVERETELLFSNSTFIANAKPTFSVESAKEFIKEIQEKYSDATHHVPAYIIGHPPTTIEHCSDDGEPAGTAGRPALAVLRGSDFGDITVVITRYFGGTKLGTGGLVRAYSESVRQILEDLPKAQKVETVITQIQLPYNLFDQAQRLIGINSGILTEQDFKEEITLSIQFLQADFANFKDAMIELSRGAILPEIKSIDPDTIFPL
jgi:uncharacterized YigZ family protein